MIMLSGRWHYRNTSLYYVHYVRCKDHIYSQTSIRNENKFDGNEIKALLITHNRLRPKHDGCHHCRVVIPVLRMSNLRVNLLLGSALAVKW